MYIVLIQCMLWLLLVYAFYAAGVHEGRETVKHKPFFYSFFSWSISKTTYYELMFGDELLFYAMKSSFAAGTGKWVSGLRTRVLWHDKINDINNKYCWVEFASKIILFYLFDRAFNFCLCCR